MKGLIHKHMIPIYNRPIRICFHRETFERMVGYELSAETNGHVTEQDGEIRVYICKNEELFVPVSVLTHESYHVVDFILELTGAEHAHGGTNEHCAYLIGYVADVILDALENDSKIEDSCIMAKQA